MAPVEELPPGGFGIADGFDPTFDTEADVGPTDEVPGADALSDAADAVGGAGGFVAGEAPPTATPTGFEIFLAL
jgi:hypothetical protein